MQAHVAVCAENNTVAEQGAEEAMRTLHKHAGSWDAPTLVAAFARVHEMLFAGDCVPAVAAGEPVVLAPSALARLLGRVQEYLPSLWTLIVAEYSALGDASLSRLLRSLLVLLHVDDGTAVASGVAALHQMSIVVAGKGGAELDQAGWAALEAMLSRAMSLDTVPALPPARRYDVVARVQLSAAQILQHCGSCMPPDVHLKVLAAMDASVQRAADAAHSGSDIAQLAAQICTAAPQAASRQNGAREHGCGGGAAPCAKCRAAALGLLWKQQNHGGRLLVKAYLSTMEVFQASAARHPTLVEARACTAEAQARLQATCAQVLDECLSNKAADGAVRRWDVVENSTVVVTVLKALATQAQVHKAWVRHMMPSLCALMRLGDRTVREAIADIFDSVVWPEADGGAGSSA